ncbi:membrane-bound transcription factor site-2 protease-like isoform X2 [Paramacrobiotus metropolitanus]|uniref:membrane-bound transcription factor site-2 protease-like isoform X2 n=1 Tax=Paramacrobiotus metropolitanus TaxID=2943436 RepID=UPI002445CF4B|nr:membrane-bound transcription factor site-2 protease-like isoform X2 [Paramacrobiotus metropolitanus]
MIPLASASSLRNEQDGLSWLYSTIAPPGPFHPAFRGRPHAHSSTRAKDYAALQSFAAFFIFFWLVVIVLHRWCCRHFHWYEQQVRTGAIQVSFGRLYLTFQHLNRPLQRLGAWSRIVRLWRVWFVCGALLSSILILPAVLFLLYLFLSHSFRIWHNYHQAHAMHYAPTPVSPVLTPGSSTISNSAFYTTTAASISAGGPSLMPIIPGINLPLSHIVPFFCSVLLSTVVHEMGHGISSASELTEVGGMGVAVLGIFPAAFVVVKNLDSQALSRQLRIMAAGVWHNLVLATIAGTFLWSMPILTGLMYTSGRGVTVTAVLDSHAALANHSIPFHVGMEIYSINQCSANNSRALERCAVAYNKGGFCLSAEAIKSARGDFIPPVKYKQTPSESFHTENSTVLECCRNTSSSLCFYMQTKIADYSNQTRSISPECLQVKKVRYKQRCNVSLECRMWPAEECYVPYLLPSERVLLFNTSAGPVLFVGDAAGLLRALRVSNYSQAESLLPLWLPGIVEIWLKYIVSVSLALAILNVVPCVGLDGQHIFSIWLDVLFAKQYLPAAWTPHRVRIGQMITALCTFLLCADVFLGFVLS